jgi:hypothetical protein
MITTESDQMYPSRLYHYTIHKFGDPLFASGYHSYGPASLYAEGIDLTKAQHDDELNRISSPPADTTNILVGDNCSKFVRPLVNIINIDYNVQIKNDYYIGSYSLNHDNARQVLFNAECVIEIFDVCGYINRIVGAITKLNIKCEIAYGNVKYYMPASTELIRYKYDPYFAKPDEHAAENEYRIAIIGDVSSLHDHMVDRRLSFDIGSMEDIAQIHNLPYC